MSRIIISRHPNGEEKLSAGYDRPMAYFFVDSYDDMGESILSKSIGYLGHRPCESAEDAAKFVRSLGASEDVAKRVKVLLESHVDLDYPESNVTIDFTKEG